MLILETIMPMAVRRWAFVWAELRACSSGAGLSLRGDINLGGVQMYKYNTSLLFALAISRFRFPFETIFMVSE